MVQERRKMEGKMDLMTVKKNIIQGVIFLLLLQVEVWTKEICFSCWQSQVLFKELDSFYSWICGSKLIPNPFQILFGKG